MIPPSLTLSNIRYVSRVKWRNPGKGVVPSPTPWCSGYWKRSLVVALDYGRPWLRSPALLYYNVKANLPSLSLPLKSPAPLSKGAMVRPNPYFPNPSTQAGYDTRLIFKWSLTSPRLVSSPRLKNSVCPTIYP